MLKPYFLVIELISYGLFVLCVWHAWKTGALAVARLAAGVLFGVLLELATIRQLSAYTYGQFAVMILDVPLVIGIGWSMIIYSAQLFSDALVLPEWARPVTDALLALCVDLSLDVIAIRLGFWDWGRGLAFQYFGVPFNNFWAWFWVVVFFSGGTRLLLHLLKGRWQLLAPFIGVIIGLIGVLATNALIVWGVPFQFQPVVVAITLLSALILIAVLRPRRLSQPAPLPAAAVPVGLHLTYLVAGIVSGIIFQPIAILFISLLMLSVTLVLHFGALKGMRSPTSAQAADALQ